MEESNDNKKALMRLLEKIKEKTGRDLTKHIDKIRVLEVEGDTAIMSDEEILNSATSELDDETADKLIQALENEEISSEQVLSFKKPVDGWTFRQILPYNDMPSMTASYSGENFSASYSFSLGDACMYYMFENESGYNIAISTQLPETPTAEDFKNALAILNKHIHSVIDVYNYMIISPEAQDAFLSDIFSSLDVMQRTIDRLNNETSS